MQEAGGQEGRSGGQEAQEAVQEAEQEAGETIQEAGDGRRAEREGWIPFPAQTVLET